MGAFFDTVNDLIVWVAFGVGPWAVMLAFTDLTATQYTVTVALIGLVVVIAYSVVRSLPQDEGE